MRRRAICRRMGPSVFSVVSSISGGCSGRDVATIVYITACSGDVPHVLVMCSVSEINTGTEGRSYYIGLGASYTSVLNLAAGCYRTVQPKNHFHALWWQLVVSWASWPAGRADGWHSKLGHRVLCARISGAFCCSGHPDHGGHLRAISCDAARWLAQLLGAQSPFASLRPLTVRTISAHGCGQQPSSHRQVEMAQQASGWQTTVRSVTCRTVQPRVTSICCDSWGVKRLY